MSTLIDTYTDKAAQARQQFGDNTAAIKQGLASQMVKESQPLQGAITGQSDAISAMAAADKNLAAKYQQTSQQAQQATQNIGQGYQMAANIGATGSTAQDTIDKARGAININPVVQTYAQDTGLISPFISSQLASSEVGTQQGVFNLADQQRKSLESAIGSESTNIANIAQYQMEKERLDHEAAVAKQKVDEAQKRQAYEDQRNMALLIGGDVTNPYTGAVEKYPTAAEKEAKKTEAASAIFEKKAASGKTFKQDVIDGKGNFRDIIQQNPGLSDEEKIALAKLNADFYGKPFMESNEELRKQNLGFIVDAGLSVEGKDAAKSTTNAALLSDVMAMPGAADLINEGKDVASRNAIAAGIKSAGGVEAYKQKLGVTNAPTVGGLKEKYGLTADDSKKVMDSIRLITSLKDVQKALMDAVGEKKTGKYRDLGIGTTGFLSQFAGTGGTDNSSLARSKINDLQAQIRNNMFGSALSAQEIEQANKILPTTGTQEQDNLNRLASKTDQKINDIRGTLKAYGVSDADIEQIIQNSTNQPAVNSNTTQNTTAASAGWE